MIPTRRASCGMRSPSMTECCCGRPSSFEECCEPILRGARAAATAEELMRARYSAFVKHEIDFLMESVVPEQRRKVRRETIEQWAKSSQWKGFELLDKDRGERDDAEGYVEFVARFAFGEIEQEHRERSHFVKQGGQWYFDPSRSKQPGLEPARAAAVGRNDPCPCGSGQKYKKCCGKAA
jgi:SEC-C motif-containing protein